MKNVKLSKLWDSLHSSYWFLPSLMALGGMALAFATLALDQTDKVETGKLSWIYQGGPEGARGLLSAVAGSMVTVAATAFSITIVALQLAASNFGPRLLRNFMQDTGNQVVLGTFIATFLYCLLVLRTIRGENYNLFVPQLSVTIGIILAIASIGVLIYFIHHASTSIQASHIIATVADELERAIDRLFPEEIGQGKPRYQPKVEELPPDFDANARPIRATKTGYLQAIDDKTLLNIACQYNLLLHLESQPGEFVVKGNVLMLVYPGKQVNQSLVDQINSTFLLGKERTEQQDIGFPINQLVEIALRALSPGINDPFTAIRCIDRLSAGLSCLAEREFPSPYRYDNHHHLRIVAKPVTFEQLIDLAFSQLRHYGQSDVVVMKKLIEATAQIARRSCHPQDKLVLERQAETILQGSRKGLSHKQDQQTVEDVHRHVAEAWRI